MTKSRLFGDVVTFVFLLNICAMSFAAPVVTFYTDETLFNASTSTSLIDFESVTTDPSFFVSSGDTLTVNSVDFYTGVSGQPGVCSPGPTGCAGRPFDSYVYASGLSNPVTITLAGAGSGFTAVGGIFGGLTNDSSATINVYGSTGLLSSHSLTVGDIGAGEVHTFLGWTVSGDEILTIDFDATSELEAMDNFRFGTVSAVPIPAAVWLFLSGLLGLVGISRKGMKTHYNLKQVNDHEIAKKSRIFVAICAVGITGSANAVILEIKMFGELTSVDTDLQTEFTVGESFEFGFTLDTTTAIDKFSTSATLDGTEFSLSNRYFEVGTDYTGTGLIDVAGLFYDKNIFFENDTLGVNTQGFNHEDNFNMAAPQVNGYSFDSLFVEFTLVNGTFAGVTDPINIIQASELLALDSSDIGIFQNSKLSYEQSAVTKYVELDINNITVSTVPVPAALWLFGSGFLGLIGIARRKRAA
jgi:hypothetical protein